MLNMKCGTRVIALKLFYRLLLMLQKDCFHVNRYRIRSLLAIHTCDRMNGWSVEWFTSTSARLADLASRILQGTPTQKTLRYIEWTVIVFSAAVYGFFSGPILDLVSPSWGPFPFLIIWFALSFVFPSDRPRWQQRLYIFVEIALMIIAVSLRLGIETLMYVFIAKACFLLSRRDVIIIVILTGIAYHITFLWTVPQYLE